jgi:hypothetical protein
MATKRHILLLLLLTCGLVSAAVTRVGTQVIEVETTTGASSETLSLTTVSGTTLILCSSAILANRSFTPVPTWDGNDMTLIRETVTGTSSNHVELGTWGYVSPAATTANAVVNFGNNGEPHWWACSTYSGTLTASVAAATEYLAEVIDNGDPTPAGPTAVYASAGTSGNALYLAGGCIGDDCDPATDDGGFEDVFNQGTGGGSGTNGDTTSFIGFVGAGLPLAVTLTWAVTDDHSSHEIEIIAAAGTQVQLLSHYLSEN